MGVFELQTKETNFKDETNKGQRIQVLTGKKGKKSCGKYSSRKLSNRCILSITGSMRG